MSSGRRSFLTTIVSLAGIGVVRISAQEPPRQGQPAAKASEFDLSWLEQMKGKHKQLYDLGGLELSEEPRPLRFARNFIDTMRDTFHLEPADINTAVGISGAAFPMNASDRIWAKYKLGERSKIIDPQTKQPAVRNIFLDDGTDISVKALQARGTIFWQCNLAMTAQARRIATEMKLPPDEVRADFVAGLNPGVKLMPSHVLALGLAQERGFTYMKA